MGNFISVLTQGMSSKEEKDIIAFLSKHGELGKLQPKDRVVLAKLVELRKVVKGAVVFKEGDTGEEMFLVKTGAVKIYKMSLLGERVLTTVNPGGFFGEMALIDKSPRSAYAKVEVDTELLVIGQRKYEEVKKMNPSIAIGLMEILLQSFTVRLRDVTQKILGVMG
ncbi:MAG: cyclic nucleotide-binding domain-containing protein [Elusimicrobiota bacterium]